MCLWLDICRATRNQPFKSSGTVSVMFGDLLRGMLPFVGWFSASTVHCFLFVWAGKLDFAWCMWFSSFFCGAATCFLKNLWILGRDSQSVIGLITSCLLRIGHADKVVDVSRICNVVSFELRWEGITEVWLFSIREVLLTEISERAKM